MPEERAAPPSEAKAKRAGWVKTYVGIAAIIVFGLTGLVYKTTAPRIMSPRDLANNGAIVYPEPRNLLPFELVDQHGDDFTPVDLQGKWTLLFFGFSHCPDFCPITLATLKSLVAKLDAGLQQNLQVVMVSVDPSRDTPQRLQQYFAGFQFDPRQSEFIGITGEFVTIRVLADQFYVPIQKQLLNDGDGTQHGGGNGVGMDHSEHMPAGSPYTIAHGETIALINPRGQFHGIFKPPFTVARLRTTLRSIVSTYDD